MYQKMLSQPYKFTEPIVESIYSCAPTLNHLLSRYAEEGDETARERMYQAASVNRLGTEGRFNISLSRRLYKTMYGADPDAFVGPDTVAGKPH